MKAIFLDIDGVLNADCDFGGRSKPNPFVVSHNGNKYCGICKTHLRALKKLVDRTDAKLILVSSWKNDYVDYLLNGYSNSIGKYLYNKLRSVGLSIADTTLGYDSYGGHMRGHEIRNWLADHQDTKDWIVLDDAIFDDYELCGIMPHLIKIDGRRGLWALPMLDAMHRLAADRCNAIDRHNDKLKYIDDGLPVGAEETFDDSITIANQSEDR